MPRVSVPCGRDFRWSYMNSVWRHVFGVPCLHAIWNLWGSVGAYGDA